MSEKYLHSDWLMDNQKYLSLQIQLVFQWLEEKKHNESEEDYSNVKSELAALRSSMRGQPALERLVQLVGLSEFEKDILLLCAGIELNSRFHTLLSTLNGSGQPSFAFALSAFSNSHWSAITPGAPLRYWRMIEIERSAILTQAPLKIDEAILHFLTGTGNMNKKLADLINPIQISEKPSVLQEERLRNIVQQNIKNGDSFPLVVINGTDLNDRWVTANYIAKLTGTRLFSIPALNIPTDNSEITETSLLWNRDALLYGFTLLIECESFDTSDRSRFFSVKQFISKIQTPLFVSTDYWMPETDRPKIIINVPRPTADEQISLWQKALGVNQEGTNGMLGRLVSQFSLTNSAIQRAAFEINGYLANDKNQEAFVKEKHLWKICSSYASPKLNDLAQRIEPVAGWDDLVLPEQQKNILKEIIVHVKNRNTVYNQWGFSSKGLRGLGISALFAGESGTGKTMASEVLANELNLDLYKIDLSKVVNKYIGETEKNLKRIFDAAENGGAILLFDEADALFGKRSEVKDSHDRYSNIEVSYLLQRMETYRGLAILTTNMKTALDKAFLRRIRFIVQFPFPDATQRAEIWSRVFPKATPKGNFNIEKLSRFTIAGGNIRNIAMNAAFLAADENAPVQMEHILKAVKTEYAKMEIPFTSDLKIKS